MRSFPLGSLLLVAACSSGPPRKSPPACPAACVSCDSAGRCVDCAPGEPVCQGDIVVECRGDGTFGATLKVCDATSGDRCTNGGCQSACEAAAGARSYIGCDYWPTPTLNSALNPAFHFAVAVANPLEVGDSVQNRAAEIRVTRGTLTVAEESVPPGEVATIELPWVPALSQNGLGDNSALVPNGAYHLVSSLPVAVYQFNPIEYAIPESASCVDRGESDGANCHSFSNDATLLLPTAALGDEYLAVARATFAVDGVPQAGFIAIVATEDQTHVTVESSAHTAGAAGLKALVPSEDGSYLLHRGTVLELASARPEPGTPCTRSSSDNEHTYCDYGATFDLTGTRVTADKPIAMFGGHSCAFVPFDTWACDHLETQLFPLATWGQTVATVQTEPQATGEANVWRIVSGEAGNRITFDPPTVQAPVTLEQGQYIELEAEGAFVASGSGRLAVAQFMVGERYTNDSLVEVGDPSLCLGIPLEQYRTSYDFLTPETYAKSYVNLIAPLGASLTLDGVTTLGSFEPIGSSSFGFARVRIPPGAHHVAGDRAFGITVSGVAPYTSYLYAGGLNLLQVSPR